MAQMAMLTRRDIEGCLKRGMNIPQIAAEVGKTPQAITAELKTRRIDSNKGSRRSNAICKRYRECRRTRVCDTNCGMDKRCKNCHQRLLRCPEFEPRTCDRLISPPFVCNGCENERICPLPRKFHVARVAQADTLKGRVGGGVLFTIQFGRRLMLAFHKERETAQTWTGIVNMLCRVAGRPLSMQPFPAILEDDGAPLPDPVMTENARAGNNPLKPIPRTRIFLRGPYCATQKPHVERNHEEPRRIPVKGTSLDGLGRDDVNVAVSHINSYARLSLGNSTPYDEFAKTYGCDGRRFLDRLGVVKIPANEVTLDPYVPGRRFKRHAERIILRRNGVTK